MKKIKKGNPRPKASGRASAPKAPEKPFRLEVGKRYAARDPRWKAEITRIAGDVAIGFWIKYPGTFVPEDSWQVSGGWWATGTISSYDLLREVPGAKRPRSRKAKGSHA